MKTSFKLFLLLISCSAYGQQVDSFSFLGNGFDQRWEQGSIKIFAEGSVESNSVNATMFSDVLFRPTFTAEAKQSFLDGNQSRVNLYSLANASVEYKLNKKWGVYAKAQSMNGYSGAKRLSELLFFGNAPFLNEVVESENLRFLRYSGYGAGATYRLSNTDKVQAKVLLGLKSLTTYRVASSQELSLYTAPGGEYIDASVASLAISEQGDGSLKGIGVDLGLDLAYELNSNNSLHLNVRDLNVTRLLDYTTIELDTSFRFTGIGYDVVRDTNTLQQYVDSNYIPIVQNARSKLKWTTLPSRINLSWHRKISCRSILITSLQTVDLGKYGIIGTVGLDHEFSDRFRLYSSIGYGNFSGIVWRESAEYRFKKINVFAGVQSLHAVVVPKLATNYGATIGISTHF